MTKADPQTEQTDGDLGDQSRLRLIFDVLWFQLKLLVDGLRDALFVPLALVALVAGLLIGGREPRQYFDRVLRFGRRSEIWLNLFGQHRGESADHWVEPLQEKWLQQIDDTPWMREANQRMNRTLDDVQEQLTPQASDDSDRQPPSSP